MRPHLSRKLPVAAICLAILALFPGVAEALTLDEAIERARKNLPSHRAAEIRVKSAEARATASLSPYFPSLDLSGTGERVSKTSPSDDGYSSRSLDGTVSWLLHDFGKRRAGRKISLLDLDTSREEVQKSLLDLELDVKTAYYNLVAQDEIARLRGLQTEMAKKDHEVAEGRNRLGVAKRSDVLQALVRLRQAELDLRRAEGSRKKALHTLNSLIGLTAETRYDLDTRLPEKGDVSVDKAAFRDFAMDRPEIRQARQAMERAERNTDLVNGSFYPDISLDLSYASSDTNHALTDSSSEASAAGIRATWSLFEFGRFYNRRAASTDTVASREVLSETMRSVGLDVENAFEDLDTAQESLELAKAQLQAAEFSYEQAFGEYRVGTGDILSLIQAETSLAQSREQSVNARLDLALSLSALERAAGTDRGEKAHSRTPPERKAPREP